MGRVIDEDDVLKVLCRELCHPGAICPDGYCEEMRERLKDVPTAYPDWDESCEDCPLYDKEKHNCPRFCHVIPKTIKELKQQKIGKWVAEDDVIIHGRCSVCGWEAIYYETDVFGMDYCPNCGAKMEVGDE